MPRIPCTSGSSQLPVPPINFSLTSALALIPRAYRGYPGAPALWSIPLCAGLTAYGGYTCPPPHFININMELWNHSRRLIEWRGYHGILVTSLFPHQLPPQSASSRYPPSLIPRRQPRGLQRTHIWIILLSRRRHRATNRHIMYITYYPHSPLFPQMQLCKKKYRTNQLQWAAAAGGG
jgi:hypothetical protein